MYFEAFFPWTAPGGPPSALTPAQRFTVIADVDIYLDVKGRDRDPAAGMFTTANFPGASTTQLNNARNLYSLLTGRVSNVLGNARLNEDTNQYEYLGNGFQRGTMRQWGFYAQDRWSPTPKLTLTAGVRVDVPSLPAPTRNQALIDSLGIDTGKFPSGNALWSPRLGFNYDARGDGTTSIRGGVGVFSGRPAQWAARLSITSWPIARRVGCVALPTWGCSTTFSIAKNASGTRGSSAKTSRPAPPSLPAFNSSTIAGSSITVPREMLTTTPSGPSASRTARLTRPRVASPPGHAATR